MTINGHLICRSGGNTKFAHVLVAEAALGKPLPAGAIVHHVNEVKTDNRPTNLVICNRPYHALIHRRMRAFAACGHYDWIVCRYCGQHDDPQDVRSTKAGFAYHAICKNTYTRARRAKGLN